MGERSTLGTLSEAAAARELEAPVRVSVGQRALERLSKLRLPAGRRGERFVPPHHAIGPRVDGKFLSVDGRRFWVKGVTYGTFSPNSHNEPYPEFEQLRGDFARMAEAGVNTVRLYTPPTERIADAAVEFGLRLIPDVCWGPRTCEWDHAEWRRVARDYLRGHVERLAGHPAILMYSIGNEIPPLMVRWYGRAKTERFLRELTDTVKETVPEALVTYANHPPAEHLNLSFLDVVSFNVYLDRPRDFHKYLARLQTIAGERPLLLSEMGFDSIEHGREGQARNLDWQVRAAFEAGCCGATVYAWTDEWTVGVGGVKADSATAAGAVIDGWAFGLTTTDRTAKPSLAALADVYRADLYRLRKKPWPKCSVVVCSYNGGKTLEQCLRSLARLNYPDYETIVVDDGSTDDTSEIARRFPVRCVRVPNGGLSRARNLGIAESTGSIVAFIDADAYADADWLYGLVNALEREGAAAVGGPNLSPPDDPFEAQCVDHAPGNPTHVLFDDTLAEHVPGCNMAYRKDAILAIGGFDPRHRAAGDDVDVCWKLLVRDKKIAYSPSAVVWHHRRPGIRAFLKQQKGYGRAEAHLQRAYPGRFNVFGHQVWRGSIYDGVHHALRREGLPSVFRPRVYQGPFGSAQFQSLYQPFLTWWFQVFMTVEWQVLSACVLASAGLALATGAGTVTLAALWLSWAAMLAISLASAAVPAVHAVRGKRWRGRQAVRGFVNVALLHLLQPLSRAAGRIKGWRETRGDVPSYPASRRLYGNLWQRSQWLDAIPVHMKACAWVCRPSTEWEESDLVIEGPGPCRLHFTTVYEDDVAHLVHYVRYRIVARWKPSAVAAGMAIAAAALAVPAAAIQMHAHWLWPALLPLAVASSYVIRGKGLMTRAAAQLVQECAAPLGMTPSTEDFT